MRAAILREQGLSRPYVKTIPLSIEEVQLDGPLEGEILIEIAAAGLCHSDLSTIEGIRPRPVPTVLGHEAAGIVREIGSNVSGIKVDDHVVTVFVISCGDCSDCEGGRPNLCASSVAAKSKGELVAGGRRLHMIDGVLHHAAGISCFAEYAVVDQRSVVKIPKGIPLEDAALFGCAVVTGVGAVLNTAKVGAGKTMAVFGLGGVGLNAVMAGTIAGVEKLIAVDFHDEKLALARELGADHVVHANSPDVINAIKDYTGGGLNHAFEMAGTTKALQMAYTSLRSGGVLTSAGLAAVESQFVIKPYEMVSREIRLEGSYMGSCIPARDIPMYLDFYRQGRLPVNRLRSGTLGLGEINLGFDRLADGAVIRQILIP